MHVQIWRRCIVWILLNVIVFSSGAWRASAEDAKVFQAGVYAIDISPTEFPVLVNGSFVSHEASKIVDPLNAHCLVLDDGMERVAIVVIDSCMAPRALLDRAKQLASGATKIRPDRMMISATHTHSAPASMGCLGTDEDIRYSATLPAKIAKGIQLAEGNLQPARIGWGVENSDENVFCRRFLMKPGTAATGQFTGTSNDRAQMNPGHQNPNSVERTGKADDALTVVSIQTLTGTPIAVLANYSTHYAVARLRFRRTISASLPNGSASLSAAQDANPPFVGIMSNGTSGDANCIDFTRPQRRLDRFTVAEDVAADALKALQRIEYFDWAPLVMEKRLLRLNVRMPGDQEVSQAREHLAKHAPDGVVKTQADIYARETVLLSEMPPTRELVLQAIRIGGLGIATYPNEVFSSTGLRVKRESPIPVTFNIELANGAEGYIPPPEQHALGGYTTWRAANLLPGNRRRAKNCRNDAYPLG